MAAPHHRRPQRSPEWLGVGTHIVKALWVLAFVVSTAAAAAEPSWLCVTDKATGFSFKNDQWVITSFRANAKYIIAMELGSFRAKELGTRFGASCRENGLWIECSFPTQLTFNKQTLRFLYIYPVGFVGGQDNNDDTPAMAIGRCSPIP